MSLWNVRGALNTDKKGHKQDDNEEDNTAEFLHLHRKYLRNGCKVVDCVNADSAVCLQRGVDTVRRSMGLSVPLAGLPPVLNAGAAALFDACPPGHRHT